MNPKRDSTRTLLYPSAPPFNNLLLRRNTIRRGTFPVESRGVRDARCSRERNLKITSVDRAIRDVSSGHVSKREGGEEVEEVRHDRWFREQIISGYGQRDVAGDRRAHPAPRYTSRLHPRAIRLKFNLSTDNEPPLQLLYRIKTTSFGILVKKETTGLLTIRDVLNRVRAIIRSSVSQRCGRGNGVVNKRTNYPRP